MTLSINNSLEKVIYGARVLPNEKGFSLNEWVPLSKFQRYDG